MSNVEIAIECTKAIKSLVEEELKKNNKKPGEVAELYAQRTRRFLTDLYTLGLAHVIAISAARSSAELVEKGLTAKNCEEVARSMLSAKLEEDKASYALYGAVLLYALKRGGHIDAENFADALAAANDPALNLISYRYGEWLKRLAEAYFK